jgi:tetraacyldisaccharide 4'-kinase
VPDVKEYCLQVVLGRRRGLVPGLVRMALSILSFFYLVGQRLHRLMYALGLAQRVRLPCPVISVGNLTTGGTGKTPMVEMLAHWLEEQGLRVAILSRGYGKFGDTDDEALPTTSPNIRRFVHPNRAKLAQRVLKEFRPHVILLDDGYQHYRIHRDLDILLIDALTPFSNGRLLPRGLLREKPSAARRADLIVLTHGDLVEPDRVETLRALLERHAPGRPVLEAAHRTVDLDSLQERRRVPLEWLRGRDILAVCGIGNPDSFRLALQRTGANLSHLIAYPDHHPYSDADYQHINVQSKEFMAETIVTTAKDAVKLNPDRIETPMVVLRIEFKITRGMEILEQRLRSLIGRDTGVFSKTGV